MKKFLSVMLVAVLALSCFCSVAFAAEGEGTLSMSDHEAQAGDTVTMTVTVTGDFANYEILFTTDAELDIVSISGVTANVDFSATQAKVAFADDENVGSHSFTMEVAVAADAAPGEYKVYSDILFVADRNLVDLDVKNTVGVITIPAPETTVPETTVPETTVPETTVPETTVPETTVPETTVPETTVPETTVPETTVPETTVPETTVPEETTKPTDPEETTPPSDPTPTDPSVPDDEPDVGMMDFSMVNGAAMTMMVLSVAAYLTLKRNAVK